jgi:16S rRNA U516 pseudouridylate synthase RsuA-like enzyme
MAKRKRKLTSAEKAEKRRRRREYMTIFINGKQKRVKRPPTIEGLPVDEFIRRNADPMWLFQNGMYEELYEWEEQQNQHEKQGDSQPSSGYDFKMVNCSDDDLPF